MKETFEGYQSSEKGDQKIFFEAAGKLSLWKTVFPKAMVILYS